MQKAGQGAWTQRSALPSLDDSDNRLHSQAIAQISWRREPQSGGFFLSNTSASLDMTASLGSEEVAYHFPASWTWRSRVLTSVCPHRCLALSVWDLSQWPPCRERDNCELLLINRLFPENPSPPASSRTRAYFVVLEIIIPTEWILAPRRPHPRPLCLL